MEYREIKAPTIEQAKTIIRREYGERARILKTDDKYEGGFLGIGRKKSVVVKISIAGADLLDVYRKNLGIDKVKKEEVETEKTLNKYASRDESLSISLVMEKLNNLEKVIQRNSFEKNDNIHPNILEIQKILKNNEFSDEFIEIITKSIMEDLPLSKIENRVELHFYVYNYIKDKIIIDNNFLFDENRKTIFALVGPTGVGKTTTITKIAANGVKERIKVELITIDGFRIGAVDQLKKYAEIMDTPMRCVEENLELQKVVTLTDANLILIDTIGRSQNDELNIVKMKQILNVKNYEVYFVLAVSATTKSCDVEKIFKSFDIFDYNSVIITKIDESENIGSILSEAIKRGKGIIYYTNGQRVPNDIEKANLFNLMSKIKGLDMEVVLQNSR
ncbi:MAG TPA: hypothetical protein PLO89_04680 [Spirochaetota bacterium]|nr:hypothetical protein [Spirochaetota bacterium]